MQRTEIRHLAVPLTEHELLQKGQLAARSVEELRELEDKKTESSKAYAEAIKDKRLTLNKLAYEIESRTEVRPVECHLLAEWAEERMVTIRDDTGERVCTRKMTEGELAAGKQPELPGVDAISDHTAGPS